MVARWLGSVSSLSLLESKLIGVCLLLTSMRVLGSYPVRGLCSAKRPKSNLPCGPAGVELVEGKSSEGVVIGLGVCAGKGVGKSEDNCASSVAW